MIKDHLDRILIVFKKREIVPNEENIKKVYNIFLQISENCIHSIEFCENCTEKLGKETKAILLKIKHDQDFNKKLNDILDSF